MQCFIHLHLYIVIMNVRNVVKNKNGMLNIIKMVNVKIPLRQKIGNIRQT